MTRHGGFTLLEVLVALALFAVIGAAAYAGLDNLLASRAALERNSERLRDVQLAFQWLRRDTEQLVARPVRDVYGEPRPALIGGARSGELLTLTRGGRDNPLDLARPTLERLAYRLDGDRLLRLSWPVLDRADGGRPLSSLLLEGVNAVRLRFMDPGGGWHERWPPPGGVPPGTAPDDSLTRLPRALEIRLELADWGSIRRLFLLPEADLG